MLGSTDDLNVSIIGRWLCCDVKLYIFGFQSLDEDNLLRQLYPLQYICTLDKVIVYMI